MKYFELIESHNMSEFGYLYSQLRYKLPSGYKYSIHVTQSPFWNCQNCTIGGVEDFLYHLGSNSELFTLMMLELMNYAGKPMVLIDIHSSKIEQFKKACPLKVVVEAPYISTNSSEMTLLMITNS